MNETLIFSVLIVGILGHELHLADYRVFAMVPKTRSLMGWSVIDTWIEICLGYVEVDFPVGLGRGVEIIGSEKRYIGPTWPRVELTYKFHFLAYCMAHLCRSNGSTDIARP